MVLLLRKKPKTVALDIKGEEKGVEHDVWTPWPVSKTFMAGSEEAIDMVALKKEIAQHFFRVSYRLDFGRCQPIAAMVPRVSSLALMGDVEALTKMIPEYWSRVATAKKYEHDWTVGK